MKNSVASRLYVLYLSFSINILKPMSVLLITRASMIQCLVFYDFSYSTAVKWRVTYREQSATDFPGETSLAAKGMWIVDCGCGNKYICI